VRIGHTAASVDDDKVRFMQKRCDQIATTLVAESVRSCSQSHNAATVSVERSGGRSRKYVLERMAFVRATTFLVTA
jgi:hypothetical protein